MSPEHWPEVESVFHSALALPPDRRETFVRQRCGTHERLCTEVMSLLRAHEGEGLLDKGSGDLASAWLLDTAPEPREGDRFGPYVVEVEIGRGGMGAIYRAADTRLGRKVALKFFTACGPADHDRLRTVEMEARTASGLNHPNVITVHDVGTAGPMRYFACELVEGVTLRERLAQGRMEMAEVVSVASQVASALVAAHQAGVVHRDIKPENIMLRHDGLVKVLDFGVAALASAASDGDAAGLSGTRGYMAPEQFHGAPPDPRGDIYSLGIVLCEMVAGVAPAAPLDLRIVPSQLRGIVARCVAPDPLRRYASAAALRSDLDKLAAPGYRGRAANIGLVACSIVLLAFAGAVFWLRTQPPRLTAVAVLPLVGNGAADTAWLADAMTDQVISALSQVGSLRVIPRASVRRYREHPAPLSQVGAELDVGAVIEGSIGDAGGHRRLTARLVETGSRRVLWSDSWICDGAGMRTVPSRIASRVAAELRVPVTPAEQQRLERTGGPVDPHWYAVLLKGRLLANDNTNPENIRRGIALLTSLVDKDPGNAAAWTGISEGWLLLANIHVAPREAMPLALHAAETALKLDPDADAAHNALGRIRLFYNWDWNGARASFDRALALNPNSSAAHESLGWLDAAVGRSEESIRHVGVALQLDPLSLWARCESALIYADSRRYDDAVRTARRTLELEPRFALLRSILGIALSQQGKHEDAIRELELAVAQQPIPTTLGFLGYAYGSAGRTAEAERVLARLEQLSAKQYVCPFEVGTAYISVGRLDRAFEWMERGLHARADCMAWLRTEPWLDPVRADSRYASLVRRVGFPE